MAKNIPGKMDWRRLYARAQPKSRMEQEALVRESHRRGYEMGQIALISKLTVNEVRAVLGILT